MARKKHKHPTPNDDGRFRLSCDDLHWNGEKEQTDRARNGFQPQLANRFSVAPRRFFKRKVLSLETAVEAAVQAILHGEDSKCGINADRKLDDLCWLPKARSDSRQIAYSSQVVRRVPLSQESNTALSAGIAQEMWCVVSDDPKSQRTIRKTGKCECAGVIRNRGMEWKSKSFPESPRFGRRQQ